MLAQVWPYVSHPSGWTPPVIEENVMKIQNVMYPTSQIFWSKNVKTDFT